jgi:hypothetical protein
VNESPATQAELDKLEKEFGDLPFHLVHRGHSAARIRDYLVARGSGKSTLEFGANADEFERRVFEEALYFSVAVGRLPYNRKVRYYAHFPDAVKLARRLLRKPVTGKLPMVYAIAKSGAQTLVPPKRWDQYTLLWRQLYDEEKETQHGVATVPSRRTPPA